MLRQALRLSVVGIESPCVAPASESVHRAAGFIGRINGDLQRRRIVTVNLDAQRRNGIIRLPSIDEPLGGTKSVEA